MSDQNGCKWRVQDHTGSVDCGEKVFRAGYCDKHWLKKIVEITDNIKELEEIKQKRAKELAKFVLIP